VTPEAFARQEPAQDVRLENLTAVRSGSDAGGGDDGGAESGSPDQDEMMRMNASTTPVIDADDRVK